MIYFNNIKFSSIEYINLSNRSIFLKGNSEIKTVLEKKTTINFLEKKPSQRSFFCNPTFYWIFMTSIEIYRGIDEGDSLFFNLLIPLENIFKQLE